MRFSGIMFLLLFALVFKLPGQSIVSDKMSDISYYSDIVANATLTNTKTKANEKLIASVEEFLRSDGSFNQELSPDIWLSTKMPSNREWRIITWEVSSEDKGSNYYGYIQMSDGRVIKLSDKSSEIDDIGYSTFNKDYWYGALYYNIYEQVASDGSQNYILFGYDNHDKFTNRKIAEVLTFNDGEPIFGKEIFYTQDKEGRKDVLSRLFLEYSSDSNVSLNYNQGLGMIVYDHLINRMGRMEGQGPTMLPDGSYCGYKLEGDKWIYVDKIFDQVSETVPRPQPILGNNKSRDLFGKKKN